MHSSKLSVGRFRERLYSFSRGFRQVTYMAAAATAGDAYGMARSWKSRNAKSLARSPTSRNHTHVNNITSAPLRIFAANVSSGQILKKTCLLRYVAVLYIARSPVGIKRDRSCPDHCSTHFLILIIFSPNKVSQPACLPFLSVESLI